MIITIKNKPLTINQCWAGRRFKTQQYKDYEEKMLLLIKIAGAGKVNGWVEVHYRFFIKQFKAGDVGNLEKALSDIIVKAGLIDDDRFIKKMTLEKFDRQGEEDHIEIEIIPTKI